MTRIITLLLTILFFSCSDTDSENPDLTDYQDVILTLQLPRSFAATRVQTPNETAINDMIVLVLREGEFQYSVAGIYIQNNGSNATTSFRARLIATDSPVTLYLVANATNEVNNAGIQPGDTEDVIKEKITREFTPAGIQERFPMFGRHQMANVPSSGAIVSGIRMLRSIARVDVDVSPVQGNFSLASIQVFRATDNIQIIPDTIPPTNIVVAPSVQAAWSTSVNTTALATTSTTGSSQQIYIPESVTVGDAANFLDATCVVIGGVYGTDTSPTYYRIDFRRSDGSYPFGQILRNHQYVFTVTGMEGSGWPTPEEASRNMESDMTVTVQEWNEENLASYFDGSHYFIISPRNLRLQSRISSSGNFSVETDVDDYTIEWINGINAGIPSPQTITNDNFEVTISADRTRINVIALNENQTGTEITDSVMIRAKRLNIPVTITQLPRSRNGNEIIRVMSMDEYGCLGSGSVGNVSFTGLVIDGRPMRMILDRHFRPDSTVNISNIYFTSVDGSGGTWVNNRDNFSLETLSQVDILYMNNNVRPNAATAQMIMDWLQAKKSRVLMLGYDWKDPGTNVNATRTNWQILQLLTDDITPLWYNGGTGTGTVIPNDFRGTRENFRIPFEVNEVSNYFFRNGPFTTPTADHPNYQPISSCYYYVTDIYWGRARVHSPNIIPLVTFTDPLNYNSNIPKYDAVPGSTAWNYDSYGDGNMVVGVDPVKRIVYMGDAQLFSREGSSVYEQASKIGDPNGNLSNEFSRIMANLWAWMIEEVVLAE